MLAEARELVSERLGLAFPSRRGDDLQQAFAARSVASLREQPTTGPEWRSLISELTVRESYFFRESGELERALSALIAERRDTRRLALWSAGCASGEEPYTLAMLLAALLPEPVGHHDPRHRHRHRRAGGGAARDLQRLGPARDARVGAPDVLPAGGAAALRAFAPDP